MSTRNKIKVEQKEWHKKEKNEKVLEEGDGEGGNFYSTILEVITQALST